MQLRLDVKPYDPIFGTGCVVRDELGKRLGQLKLHVPKSDDSAKDRELAEAVVKQIADKVNGATNHTTATTLPQHA